MESLSKVTDIFTSLQKTQYLFVLLPLISFIYFKVNFYLIAIYTIVVGIHSVYIHILHSFKKVVSEEVLLPKKGNKKSFLYIPYIYFYISIFLLNVLAFFYSFYLSFFRNDPLFLLHLFVFTVNIFVIVSINYLKKNIPDNIKKD